MTIKRIPVPEGFAPSENPLAGTSPLTGGEATEGERTRRERHRTLNAEDGTNQLLASGFWTMLVGGIAAALTLLVFGGVGPQGAHSNAGWLSLMISMMSTPFAILLLLLGGAKWLRNYGLSKHPHPSPVHR
jgi:hypothetical protein